jgi:N-dimethylarginine dimethylaminohydrolase
MRSTTAPLRRALLCEPADGDFASAGWLAIPDVGRLRSQHAALADLLSGLGVDVTVLPAAHGLVDSCYAYDPVLVAERGALELRMAKPARVPEPSRLVEALAGLGVPLAGRIDGAAVADAGDMFWLDENTLAVGRGYRTNAAAHEQLAAILSEEGAAVERFDLPHHRGPENLLHLLSVVSPIAADLALVFEPLCPVPLLEALDERSVRRLHCDADELKYQGCNVLAVRPGVVVMADTAPKTRRILERAGCDVHVYDASELNLGEGGPTCLTQPLLRAD